MNDIDRRDFLALLGFGGIAFASGCTRATPRARAPQTLDDFFFMQLTDTHWGFRGPPNPEADISLKKAVAAINASVAPDFVVFTGDLTHTTDDPAERRTRMAQFKEIVAPLKVKAHFLPGEHDASIDRGEAFREAFGATHWSFDHKGIHFVGLDNVSDPAGGLGDEQLAWLDADLAGTASPIVVFAHRPLFDLYPQWEWATRDGARAIEILGKRESVTVFYGHIHQEHHHVTGRIAHHAARSLIFPLPAPGSVPKRAPLPWDPAATDHGIGYRTVSLERGAARAAEIPLK